MADVSVPAGVGRSTDADPHWLVEGMAFQDQVVWITGASSGIGAALVPLLAGAGARLILSARRPGRLDDVRRAAAVPGGRIRSLPLDLEDLDSLAGVSNEAEALFGRIDGVVHAAGLGQRGSVADTDFAVDRRLMAVNHLGPVAITKAVLPGMLRRGSGRFTVVSSIAGLLGPPRRSGYAASKHALHGFFDALRAESVGTGVKVTIVCPGYVDTDFGAAALIPDGTPQGRDGHQRRGIPVARCARRIFRAMEYDERQVLIGGREVLAAYIHRLAPGLVARLLPRLSPP